MKTKTKSKWMWLVALGLIVTIGAALYHRTKSSDEKQTFRAVTAQRETLAITVLSTGGVQPETRVDIKPSIAGRAETVLVKEGDRVKKGQTLLWMSSTERAALIDAARAKGPEEEKKWEELYRPVPVVAPITGTIILRSIEPGQSFATTDAILAMSDRLTVLAQVDETDIAQIKKGQPAAIVLDAYPGDKIEGHVEKIAYEATTTNNVTNYNVTVVPTKTPDFMRSGMTANVTFEIRKKENVVTVPTEALKTRDGQTFVTVPASQEASAKKQNPVSKPVQIGLSDGKLTEITEGVSEGDTILISVANLEASSAGANPFMPTRTRTSKGRSSQGPSGPRP